MQQNLFNHKTLKKMCSEVVLSPIQIEEAMKWLEYLDANELENEKENYLIFSKIILEKILGYEAENLNHEVGNIEFSYPKNATPVLGIEAKGTKTNDLFAKQNRLKGWHDTPVHQLWSYMGEMNLDYGIVTNYKQFILIDKNEGSSKTYTFNFELIKEDIDNLKEFIAVFSNKYLIGKGFAHELKEKSKLEEREFTNDFYSLFSETRLLLIKEFEHNGATKDEAIHCAQLFLNRLMFVFFCEDTGKLSERTFEKLVLDVLRAGKTAESLLGNLFCSQLKHLFTKLDKGSDYPGEKIFPFNGGLFSEKIPDHINFNDFRDASFFDVEITQKRKTDVSFNTEVDELISHFKGKLNHIITNLLFMSSFDFKTEVSVNILGHIFEQSLSDIENLKEGKTISKRKKDGIYYTPEYITEYICRNTIISYLSKNNATSVEELVHEYQYNIEDLEEKFKNIKILDPACGSGAFLIKAVDILLEIHKEIQDFKEFKGNYLASPEDIKTKRRKKSRKSDTEVASQFTFEKWNEEDEARTIIENNIYGVDINEESVDVTKLSLFLKIAKKNKKLIDLSDRIKCGNSLVEDSSIDERAFDWNTEFKDVLESGGFDIIIGNPPYGAELSKEEQKHLNSRYSIGSTDTAQLMMKKSYDLLKDGGVNGFIIPKPFIFASNWKQIRALFLPHLDFIVDCKKVWDEVKLEQIIYILRKSYDFDFYGIKYLDDDKIISKGSIDKIHCENFGFILNNISNEELNLGLKIKSTGSIELNSNKRGAGLQKYISSEGVHPVLGGANVQRYSITGVKGYVSDDIELPENSKIGPNSLIAQNIIAHIENPVDHIKIMATIPDADYILIDTINQIRFDESISNKYVLALVNSKLISWYVYRFIFAKAIRTMHFDSGVTSRIIIPKLSEDEQKPFIESVDLLLDLNRELASKKDKFLRRLSDNFGIPVPNKGKLANFYQLTFKGFTKELAKKSVKLSLKQQDEWEEYFELYKQDLDDVAKRTMDIEQNINEMVYSLYGVTEKEKCLIE